jgi:hypothetical protein
LATEVGTAAGSGSASGLWIAVVVVICLLAVVVGSVICAILMKAFAVIRSRSTLDVGLETEIDIIELMPPPT